jgi:phage terminase small subunit
MALTNKQKAFAEAYLRCWSATEAAKVAGYSEKTARAIGSENLTKPDIKALIQERMRQMQISADEILLLLINQARGSIKPFMKINSQGSLSFDFSTPEALDHMHLIKKIKCKHSRRIVSRDDNAEEWEDETVEIELHDAQNALQLLGRHFGLFDNKFVQVKQLNTDEFDKALDKVYGARKMNDFA